MKILEISNYFPEHVGGIEYVAFNLVKQGRQNHEVIWMACDVKDRPHIATPSDIPLPALNFTEENLGFPYPLPWGKSINQIVEQVKRCDIVHIHDSLYVANLIAFLASRWYHKPVLVTQHIGIVPYTEAYKNILQLLAYHTLGKYVLGNAEHVVFISERVQKWFEARMRFRQPSSLITNGVDRELFHPATREERNTIRHQLGYSDDVIVLLFVGRFTQKKGLGLIREIASARPAYHWLMIGSGEIDPLEWRLPNLTVVTPQPQSALQQYYTVADLLVLPSVGEGFPLAVQEALSCGLPAAVSIEMTVNHPDVPLISLNLSDLGSVQKILDELFRDPALILAMKTKAVEYSKQWNWETVFQKYELLLTETAQNNQPEALAN